MLAALKTKQFIRRRGLIKLLAMVPMALLGAGAQATPITQSRRVARLEKWYALARLPLLESPNPVTRAFIQAASAGVTVSFYYQGGSTPGGLRRIHPDYVFTTAGGSRSAYVTGYCHLRKAPRAFRVDRISLG
jgi:predicted DNA-binding transcriptional regulator YafY